MSRCSPPRSWCLCSRGGKWGRRLFRCKLIFTLTVHESVGSQEQLGSRDVSDTLVCSYFLPKTSTTDHQCRDVRQHDTPYCCDVICCPFGTTLYARAEWDANQTSRRRVPGAPYTIGEVRVQKRRLVGFLHMGQPLTIAPLVGQKYVQCRALDFDGAG